MRSKLALITILLVSSNIATIQIYDNEYDASYIKPTAPVTYPSQSQNSYNKYRYPTPVTEPSTGYCRGMTSRLGNPMYPGETDGNSCDVYQNNDVVKAFFEFAITPQVIPRPPTRKLLVKMGNEVVNLGNHIPAFVLGNDPYAVNFEGDPESMYTVIFFNADTNYILYGTLENVYLDYLTVNIPGSNIPAGNLIVDYRPYLPIPGYGPQRYVGLVYEQNDFIQNDLDFILSAAASNMFNLTEFVETNDLGDPTFGNFFVTSISICDKKPFQKIFS